MINTAAGYRDFLVQELEKEFLGPGSEEIDNENVENERISESPLKRYFVGILYPQKVPIGDMDLDPTKDEAEENVFEKEETDINKDEGSSDQVENLKSDSVEEYNDKTITFANQYCPSSYGITFFIKGNDKTIKLKVNAAKYVRLKTESTFILLTPDEMFIKDIPNKDSFKIEGNKFYYTGNINKNHREEIREFCRELFFKTLDKVESSKIKELLSLNKYYELDPTIKEKLNYHYLTFSRIYDKCKNFKYRGYERIPCMSFEQVIVLDQENELIEKYWPEEKLKIIIKNRPADRYDIKKVTASVINTNEIKDQYSKYTNPELSYFQNKITVEIDKQKNQFVELSKLRIGYTAEDIDHILYRSKKIFAAGHGCSVNWEDRDTEKVWTEFLPKYEVPRVNPEPDKIKNLNLNIFDMQKLAYRDLLDNEHLIKELNLFSEEYLNWLRSHKDKLSDDDKELLESNEEQCKNIVDRIKKGINLLSDEQNKNTMLAFRLTNEVMLMQRANTEKYFRNNDTLPELCNNHSAYKNINNEIGIWRPFQLAFILICINSIVNPESRERKIADLLWFPTGGGKTEAYLGVIAFTIFYSRLSSKTSLGTLVIMRYTLRLLTTQQFQRAATLICACEFIRLKYEGLGESSISIGLWVGKENTPNTAKDAVKYVNKLAEQHSLDYFKSENPFQLTNCPWCSTSLLNEAQPVSSGYVSHPIFHFRCINNRCFFNKELPIQVVDELIYKKPPSLLFATVDKFARLAWDPNTQALFGLKEKFRQVERIYDPPNLILQDELHLISGPLGSMFGIYEAVIDYLCSRDNIFPKIICSTATIRKANEQIKSLFNRDTNIFPPNYDKVEDTYFSEEIPLEKERGRLYFGVMTVGQTQQSAQIKIFYSLLYNNYLNEASDNVVDTYSTIVSYYNTINELGVATSLLNDDVKEKIKMLQDRKRSIISRPVWYKELTSRMRSKELPIILNELEQNRFSRTSANKSIPLLLTTNMFSVGIDISRINLMFMNGQPKSTSEYIQSTSRVGRKDPGIVITLFDGFRPRDKSHYENFKAFHSAFYRFVEPAGATPFSIQARSRVLHTALIIVARLLYGLPNNKDASIFDSDSIKGDFVRYLLNRINSIDPSEVPDSEEKIENLIKEWTNKTNDLVYSINIPQNASRFIKEKMENYVPLMRDIALIKNERERKAWPVMQSLRNVDIPTICKMKE